MVQESGSVAVDDLTLTPECSLDPATPTPPPLLTTTEGPCQGGFFPCADGTCIPFEQVSYSKMHQHYFFFTLVLLL